MAKKRYIIIWRNSNQITVELMAESGVYMMVRAKGCIPFVCHARDYIGEA